jgi:hypothetical protein
MKTRTRKLSRRDDFLHGNALSLSLLDLLVTASFLINISHTAYLLSHSNANLRNFIEPPQLHGIPTFRLLLPPINVKFYLIHTSILSGEVLI